MVKNIGSSVPHPPLHESERRPLCESLIPVIVGKILTKVIELADCSVRT